MWVVLCERPFEMYALTYYYLHSSCTRRVATQPQVVILTACCNRGIMAWGGRESMGPAVGFVYCWIYSLLLRTGALVEIMSTII
jgi:hypothetical protein